MPIFIADRYGVKRFFGVPSGDCSLDIIRAAADHGIDFVPARAEAPASMAAITGEPIGTPIGIWERQLP